MDKRLFTAIFLSLVVFLLWSSLVSKVYHVDNKSVTDKSGPVVAARVPTPLRIEVPDSPITSPVLNVPLEKIDINFAESEAAIKEVLFKDYQGYSYKLGRGLFLAEEGLRFTKESSPEGQAVFTHSDENKKIIKRFIFSNDSYSIGLEIELHNLSSTPMNISASLMLGLLDFSGDQEKARYQDVFASSDSRIVHLNARKDAVQANIKFAGIRDRYFCAIIEPIGADHSVIVNKISPKETEVSISGLENTIYPGQQIIRKFSIYLGPQDLKIINRLNPAWSGVVYYGTFDVISHLLLQILDFLHNWLKNWGLAIVVLSILIYFLLYPLSLKQMRSMKEMQLLQPIVEELRKTHKDNPQKLNKEILELYRKHKVNPFSGCLPLLLQIPIFFSLYQALMRFTALKGAQFLWIKDLSLPDRLFLLPVTLPLLGNEFNILPIVMAIGMFFQQKMSMSATASGSSEQQKIMLVLFPVMFGIIFYRMPAALVLYWFVNSSLMLIYQIRSVRKK